VPDAASGLGVFGVAVLFAPGDVVSGVVFGEVAVAGLGAGDAVVASGVPRPANTKYKTAATTITAPAISAMRAVGDSGPVSLGMTKTSVKKKSENCDCFDDNRIHAKAHPLPVLRTLERTA
jgi:hypothetical protein